MNTIKHDPELRYDTFGFTIKEAYKAPESEILEINMSRTVLEGGSGGGDNWGDGGED